MLKLKLLFLITFGFVLNNTVHAQFYYIPIYAVTSLQEAQPGAEVSRAIDGNPATIYHSKHNTVGIPDELNFYLTTTSRPIKQIVYTPRQSGLNGMWTNVDVLYSTFDNSEIFIEIATDLAWEADALEKVIDLAVPLSNVAVIRFVVNAGYNNFSSCAEMTFNSEEPPLQNDADCEISTSELQINNANDIKAIIQANGSFASSFQPGENIDKSFDNNVNTLYHSPWNGTSFPITLNYRLDGNTEVDYLKYTPRLDGSANGWFGNVIIKYNTLQDSEFVTLTTFDFAQLGIPETVLFPSAITPLNIQLIVEDGANNFASCAEMEFFKINPSSNPTAPNDIFEDELFSSLLPNVTQTQINAISSTFYKGLAQCIFDDNYDKAARLREYEVYTPLNQISQELKVGSYDPFENPTGIVFEEGEKVALFVHNLPAASVQLKVKNFADGYYGDQSYYALKEGLNVFEISNSGLGYISYFNANLDLDDVQINMVSGTVNGVFDLAENTNSDWPDVLMKNDYEVVDIIGDYTHLVFNRPALLFANPLNGLDLIKKYDTIVKYERLQMGLFKYDRSPKNRQFAFSEEGNGWYAGGIGIHLDLTWGVNGVVHPYQLDLWGIPHEFGHINQIRPDLNWIGTTEVTNNIYSVWVNYKMNNEGYKYTRLESENLTPNAGQPNEIGGRINGAIHSTFVEGNPLQDTENYDVFKVLVPFWQLQLYYQAAGASRNAPLLTFDTDESYTGVDYANWYGTVAEMARTNAVQGETNGEFVMNFVKNTCDAVQEDLTDFFIHTGFLKPIDVSIDDYGMGDLYITQTMVDEAITYVKEKGYELPISPVINYLSAHSVDAFRNQVALVGETGVGVTLNGGSLLIDNTEWLNVVAFETYDLNDELMHVSIKGTGDLSLATTTVYYPGNAYKVYAVGYDGHKILVYPNNLSVPAEKPISISMYPNPIGNTGKIHLKHENMNTPFTLTVTDLNGSQVFYGTGTLKSIEEAINKKINAWGTGSYIFNFKAENGEAFQLKLIRS